MSFVEIISNKPVLIGLHLGFAIVGIDGFLWMLGEIYNEFPRKKILLYSSIIGTIGFIASWLAGGYYYVMYYGNLVKPVIKAGTAPWAHAIIMESKEHVFLFLVPLAITAFFITLLSDEEYVFFKIKSLTQKLVFVIALLGLLVGAMGFIISAAARWGV